MASAGCFNCFGFDLPGFQVKQASASARDWSRHTLVLDEIFFSTMLFGCFGFAP
jgi:hypothetical protein